ncbi:type II toxin-antitoxin system HicA family toxin [Nitrosococcus wardiae]|uniref:Type II toxin-antitoxin system HicA family toxin n=1 Tax=Nitrosococcus wardiae TaxID=1814290 RepID=A0A4P7C352_9GAMM|nr:type II toxin-antitoxin system HicA family toxin [Nitrosococcus wardiae]QBQ56209.1 type II toxin-antitoxin system HicA family toxin [Nitrosococcus wardiae]
MKLNKKQKRTLEAIFARPTPHLQIVWQDIEQLILACGGRVLGGSGSAVRLVLGERRAYLHRPHPHKEVKAYQVKAVRHLLEAAGITPATVR